MLIYKITNIKNNKVYIGLTVGTLNNRWTQHKGEAKRGNIKPLYIAMREDKIENFTVEEIDNTDSIKTLGMLERKYIKQYKSQDREFGYNLTAGGECCQWDANPRARLSFDEVVQIREIYAMGELGCKQCWKMFEDKISFSAFEKIWEGITWKGIMSEIYTEENINYHRYNKSFYSGENNPYSKYSNEEVWEMRKYYKDHTLEETFQKYGYKSKTKGGFRSTLEKTYKHIPHYSKVKKCWLLNNEPIDINNYNPVSTISESGE